MPLETETCSRCGGSGHYSYCYTHGTRCFKCGGRKVTYTKRGHAAALWLEERRKVPASEIKVGDVVSAGGITTSGIPYNKFARVVSIEPAPEQRGASLVNGEMVPYVIEAGARIRFVLDNLLVCLPDSYPTDLIRKGWSAEEKAKQLAEAEAYQATLTKQGKIKKR